MLIMVDSFRSEGDEVSSFPAVNTNAYVAKSLNDVAGKKPKLSIDKPTSRYSSKLTPISKNLTKVTHAQKKIKRKLDSKRSCSSKTDQAKKSKLSVETGDTKTGKSTSSDEDMLNKIKKYKSLDYVTSVRPQNVSKISVRKRVSEKLKFPQRDSITSLRCKKLLSDILNSFSGAPKSSNNTAGRGKSMSFEAIKFDGNRQISKSSSVENSKVRAVEKPIGVFNVYKKTYIRTPGPYSRKLNITETANRDDYCHAQPSGSLERRANVSKKNSSRNFSDCQKPTEKRVLDNRNWESEIPPADSSVSDLNPKEQKTVREASAEKKPVALCQCLHYHTEDGLKRICLQNNSSASKELGQKFFRVNYFSNKQDEGDEESEEKKELVDKETCTESYVEVKHKRKLSVEKKSSKKEKTRKNSLEKLKKTEMLQESSSELSRGPNTSLGQKSNSRKHESLYQKPKKQLKPGGQKRNVQKKLREVWMDKSEHEESLKELQYLEKLFSKLNSMEKLKVKRKMLDHPKSEGKQLAHRLKKIKTDGQKTESDESMSSTEAQVEYLRQKRKIRNSIIRQLRNWLQLELDET